MKKVLTFIIALIAFLVLSGCKEVSSDYEDSLLDMGAEALSNFRDELSDVGERTYEVSYHNGIYTININGNIQKVQKSTNTGNGINPTNVENCTSKKIAKIVDTSKTLLEEYIKSSSVLKNKEELINDIQRIEPKMANLGDAPAMYQDGNIYISRANEKDVCEWMVVHELVHGLAVITNGGIENEPYPYDLFNEAITDVITMAMNPEIKKGTLSGYLEYHEIALTYIGIFKEEAIKAYFYGYDSIWEEIGKEEVDFFVLSVDNYYSNLVANACVNNSLLKWMRQAE